MNEQKTLWFRVGTEIPFTEEEYHIICKGGESLADEADYEAACYLLKSKLLSGGYRVSGEVYAPEICRTPMDGEWPQTEDREFDLDFEVPSRSCPVLDTLLMFGLGMDILSAKKKEEAHPMPPKKVQKVQVRKCRPGEKKRRHYLMEDQINDCFKFLGMERKNAYLMSEVELDDAESELEHYFRWENHPAFLQAVPVYIPTGTFVHEAVVD